MEGHKIEQKFERSILGAQTARQNCTIGYYNLLYNLLEQAPKGGDFIRSELLHAFGSISARLSLISGIVQLCTMMLMEYQQYQLFPPNRVWLILALEQFCSLFMHRKVFSRTNSPCEALRLNYES